MYLLQQPSESSESELPGGWDMHIQINCYNAKMAKALNEKELPWLLEVTSTIDQVIRTVTFNILERTHTHKRVNEGQLCAKTQGREACFCTKEQCLKDKHQTLVGVNHEVHQAEAAGLLASVEHG